MRPPQLGQNVLVVGAVWLVSMSADRDAGLLATVSPIPALPFFSLRLSLGDAEIAAAMGAALLVRSRSLRISAIA